MIWLTANAGAYEPSTTMSRLYCSKGEATALSQMTSINHRSIAEPSLTTHGQGFRQQRRRAADQRVKHELEITSFLPIADNERLASERRVKVLQTCKRL